MRRWLRRLSDFVAPGRRDQEIQDELRFHVESLERHYRDAGLSDREATLAARRRFGSVAHLKDRGHDARGGGMLDDAARELRQASRRLWQSPAFTLTVVTTLALAIGATIAMFAVVERIVLEPLPYPESDRIALLDHAMPRINVQSGIGMTPGLYFHYLDRSQALDAIAVYRSVDVTVSGRGEPERLRVTRTTASLADVLRVQPMLGRWFTAAEAESGAPAVMVLSHGLWLRRFGGDTAVVGRQLALDGVSTEVIGVMPPSFAFPDVRTEAWTAAGLSRAAGFGLPFTYVGIGRVRAETGVAGLRRELDALIDQLPDAYPGDRGVLGNIGEGGLQSAVVPLKIATVGQVAATLWILLGAVAVVLLVACANIANLFMVRASTRQREIAVRRALGSGAAGLARCFVAESVLVAGVGCAGGVALAAAIVRVLASAGPVNLPRLNELRLDGVSIAATATLGAAIALVFGALPFLQAAPSSALREAGRTTASRARHRLRQGLMGAQVALALVLLVAAGLMVRSFQKLRAIDPGFRSESTMTFRLALPERGYPTRAAAATAHRDVLDELSSIPGIEAAAAASGLPLAGGCFGNTILVRGQSRSSVPEERPSVQWCAVSDGYLSAMGRPLLRGRDIVRADVDRQQPVALVNEALLRILFPDQDPIGERVRSNAPPTSALRPDGFGGLTWDGAPQWLEIVGVIANTPTDSLTEPRPIPAVYLPMSIGGGPDIPAIKMLGPNVATMTYVVRSPVAADTLVPALRRAVANVDPDLAVAQVRTLQDLLDEGAARMAFTMLMLAAAASVALLLGVVGIYGVIAYIIGQRRNEIGVRLALGAEPTSIVRLFVRQGGRVALTGIIVGLAAAVAGSRFLGAILYGVSPQDPVVLGMTALGLLGIAIVSCWIPARRAARIDPATVLRSD